MQNSLDSRCSPFKSVELLKKVSCTQGLAVENIYQDSIWVDFWISITRHGSFLLKTAYYDKLAAVAF